MNRTAEEWKRHYEKESPCEHAIIVELYPEAVADILELDTQAKEQAQRIAALEAELNRQRKDAATARFLYFNKLDSALAATPAPKPDEAMRLLRAVEWGGTEIHETCSAYEDACPCCHQEKSRGHSTDCAIWQYLAKHKEKP